MKHNLIFLVILFLSLSYISCENNSKEYEKLLLEQYDELRTIQIVDFEIYFTRSQELLRPELEDEFEKMKILKRDMYKFDTIFKKKLNRTEKEIFVEKHRKKIKIVKNDIKFTDFKFLSKVNDSVFDAVVKNDFSRAYRDIMKDYWVEYHSIPYCGYTVYDSITVSGKKTNPVFITE